MIRVCILSFCVGFLSLCMEILWVRLFGFTNHSIPQAFAWVLVFYLIGIAFGALLGRSFCNDRYNLWRVSGIFLLLAGTFNIVGPLFFVQFAGSPQQVPLGAAIIFLTAFLSAIIFPIAHHLSTPFIQNDCGKKISRVYVSNVMGATLGPLITSFLFLTYFTTQQTFLLCGLSALTLGLSCFYNRQSSLVYYAGLTTVMVIFFSCFNIQPYYLIAKAADPVAPIGRIVENQYGIIMTFAGGKGGDYIFGGNVYDGRTNLDPRINSNQINRLIILAAIQKKPQKVLMIGLSVGTWLKLVTSFPGITSIDVLEINPGYLQIIKDYPQQWSALQDPRVQLIFDDGRRWLLHHPQNKYDLIIMNNTFHWRAYSTNLLSINYLTLVKQHMTPNAIFAFNSTSSPDVLQTASAVFSFAFLYENFVIAGNFDWRQKLRSPEAYTILASLTLDGKPLFPPHSQGIIAEFLQKPTLSVKEVEAKTRRPLEVITDSNLIPEYKYGRWL